MSHVDDDEDRESTLSGNLLATRKKVVVDEIVIFGAYCEALRQEDGVQGRGREGGGYGTGGGCGRG